MLSQVTLLNESEYYITPGKYLDYNYLEESFAAKTTDMGSFASMPHIVLFEELASAEFFSTLGAFMRLK